MIKADIKVYDRLSEPTIWRGLAPSGRNPFSALKTIKIDKTEDIVRFPEARIPPTNRGFTCENTAVETTPPFVSLSL